jgi:GGDEF domain-containing protein
VCYFDLDAFKPYNDVYGYAQGDQIILHLAGLLKVGLSGRLDFIGHVGGDDFLVVMRSADWRERVVRILEKFSASVANFYSAEHVGAGSMQATDRDGSKREFPLLTLSVAALDSETAGASSADAIAHMLAHVKKLAKQRTGNSFVLRSDERVVDLLAAAARTTQIQNEPDLLPMEQLVG